MSLNNPGYFFKLKIIQPNFDELYKKYEQMFVDNQKRRSVPAAIKVQGKLKKSKIENNLSIGTRLLEADEIENSSIKRNRTFLLSPKDNHLRIEKLEEKKSQKFWERSWFQIIILISAIATIIGVIISISK